MVTFTCDVCNEALKKNKIAGHRKCKGATFTCIDCNVTFHGNSYSQHFKCVTEGERYGGANYVAKENKGEAKQQMWIESVREAAKKLRNGQEKQILLNACKHENMPRKQKPFINFLKSSGKCRDEALALRVWENLLQCLEWAKKDEAAKAQKDKAQKEARVAPENEVEAEEPCAESEPPVEPPKKKKKA